MYEEDERVFIPELKTKYKFVKDQLGLCRCPQQPIMLRPKQCWLVNRAETWFVMEFFGMIGNRLAVRKWVSVRRARSPQVNRREATENYVMMIEEGSQATGAGSSCTYEYNEVFPRSVAINVVLSGDETRGVGNNKMIIRKIIKLKTDVPPLRPTMLITENKLVQEVREALGENIYQKWDIFTDGAYSKLPSKLEDILQKEKSTATTGLVFIRRETNWYELPIHVFHFNCSHRHEIDCAYPVELLGLAVAGMVIEELGLDALTFTDCKAAMEVC